MCVRSHDDDEVKMIIIIIKMMNHSFNDVNYFYAPSMMRTVLSWYSTLIRSSIPFAVRRAFAWR